MTDEKAKHVICAVRARPHSVATVTRAIDLALELGARLTFFYVLDAEFKAQAPIRGALTVIYQELVQMGKFVMLILCDRACRRGVVDVDYIVREGNVRRRLLELAAETEAEILVMGSPVRGPGRTLFKPGEFEDFVARLEQVGNLQVVVVPPAQAGQEGPVQPSS
jgi:nucleotide-binding universal stress UspA family protein